MPAAALAWSGGKDCSLALHAIRTGGLGADGTGTTLDPAVPEDLVVEELLTTVTAEYDRVSMHGVRRELLERQSAALDLPVRTVEIPDECPMDRYRELMLEGLADCESAGVDAVVYADLFLEEIRAAREDLLGSVDLVGRWPLWGLDTTALAEAFLALGFEARVVCVDASALDRSFAGRRFDADFLADLPADVDPCGEHGEFHTFVTDGPPFDHAVAVETGDVVERSLDEGRFVYADLHPA